MKITTVVFICLLLLSGAGVAQVGGGAVTCVNCSTSAQQASQYAQETVSALRAVQMATIMVNEAVQLAKHPSTNILADIGMLSTILVQSQGLAGTMAQISNQFSNTYAPYSPNPVVDYASQYNKWATTTLKTLNGSLMSAGYQGTMLQNEGAWMSQIQLMNNSVLGRDQSIQLTNTIAVQEVSQLQALRQLMLADMQSKAAFMAGQVTQQQSSQVAQQSGFDHASWSADTRSW